MDEDRKLYLMDEYKFTYMSENTEKPVPDGIAITMNDAQVFADRTMAICSGANMQAEVLGKKLSEDQKTLIEEFLGNLFISIDDLLMQRELGNLGDFLREQIFIRGRVVSRNLVWEDKPSGRFIPDLLTCDSRYFVYEYGDHDLDWGNYTTTRRRELIENLYPKSKQYLKAKYGVVDDFWDCHVNSIYVNNHLVDERENTLGYVPYTVQRSGSGSLMLDKDHLKYTGESIFAPVRHLYPEVNRLTSILQTLNMMTFAGATQYETQEPDNAVKPENPYGLFKSVPVEKGGGYRLIPVADIKNGTRLFYSIIMAAIQRGSLPNLDYGNLTFPLSAVAISRLTQTKDAIFVPRLQALALYYRATSKMFIDQYINGGIPAEVGERGIEKTYNAADLNKEFAIRYKFFSTSPEQDIANTEIAQQQFAIGMSRETVYKDTLKLENWKGEIQKGDIDRAKRADAALTFYDLGHDLIDEAKKPGNERYYLKAELVLQQLEAILKNRVAGGMAGLDLQANTPRQIPGGKSIMPLTGGTAGQGQPNNPERDNDESPAVSEAAAQSRQTQVRKQTEEG
jgi:hypothetical protein